MVCLTSLRVWYSACSEPVPPVLWLLSTFSENSQGSMSNISCCMSCMQFISFSLLVASQVLTGPGCFLRVTARWWVFLLHDTTRFTLPGLFPERLTGYLRSVQCFNILLKAKSHYPLAVATKLAWPTSFCWAPPPAFKNTFLVVIDDKFVISKRCSTCRNSCVFIHVTQLTSFVFLPWR